MATTFRWLLRLFMAMVVLAGLAIFLVYYLASRSLPDYTADYSVDGITASVEIVRDNANVPHILGTTDADTFYGLGFAHAQDRLWQMTMMRRTAQGRLSELFGERTYQIDDLIRRLDLYRLAVQSVDDQTPEALAALKAYSAGVNSWMNQVNQNALGRGAPEFFLFSNEIAPWQPADSLALIKVMALQLSGHVSEEVLYARTSRRVAPERLRDLIPDVPGPGIAALPEFASLFPNLPVDTGIQQAAHIPFSPIVRPDFSGASNAWAAAASRSATGSTLLANDPHLGLSSPTIWYLARLELESGGVIGGTIPGIPTILAGRSQSFGWGLTSAYLDDQDIMIEQVNPDNANEVLTPDGFRPLKTRQSIIRIKDQAPRTITLQWSDNGPIIPAQHYGIGSTTPAGHVAALSWTALSGDDTSYSAAMQLMGAKTVDQGIAALETYVAPAQNIVMADMDTIAMKMIGEMPQRSRFHQTKGRLPSKGWLSDNQWRGRLNYSANPEFVKPVGGILGNTNNKTLERPFPLHVSYYWGDTQRIQRWRRLMQNRQVHTRESFIETQLDTVSFSARSLVPLVAADLWFSEQAAPQGTPEHRRQIALGLLANWSGEMNEHLPEPLIYSAWMRALQNRLIQDDLGPLSGEFIHVEPLFIERVFKDVDGASVWCDILQSAIIETCTDMARQSLDEALVWLTDKYGPALESLRWGDAHQARHDHQVLGQIPVLRHFVNIRQSTSGGDNTLQRGLTLGSGDEPFTNVHGAAYRGVYDFADPDSSVFITSTGQSGHFLSRHYEDLGVLWRRGEYIPMSLDLDLARAASVGVTILNKAAE